MILRSSFEEFFLKDKSIYESINPNPKNNTIILGQINFLNLNDHKIKKNKLKKYNIGNRRPKNAIGQNKDGLICGAV